MIIWLDADACPRAIKDIITKAAEKNKIKAIFVANQHLNIPRSPYLEFQRVPQGLDVADNHIVQNLSQDDLVITADIPLAADIVEKGGVAINPRGTLYTRDNVKEKLSLRNFMEEIRTTQHIQSGPTPFGNREKQAFASVFDRFITRYVKNRNRTNL